MAPVRSNAGDRAELSRESGPVPLGPADAPRLLGVALLGMVTLAIVMADWESPIRPTLTIMFLLFGPGLALTDLLEINDLAQRIAVAIGASLAIDTLVSVVLLYSGLFSADAAFAIIVGLTCLTLLGALLRRHWHVPNSDNAYGAPT